jgi:hypothetical protein
MVDEQQYEKLKVQLAKAMKQVDDFIEQAKQPALVHKEIPIGVVPMVLLPCHDPLGYVQGALGIPDGATNLKVTYDIYE